MSLEQKPQLSQLASVAATTLDDEQRARVFSFVRSEGPRLVRRADRIRRVGQAGAAVLLLTLILAPVLMTRRAPKSRMLPAETTIAKSERRCESWPVVAPRSWTGRLELAQRGHATLETDAAATVSALDPCEVRLHLRHGRVRVEAHDLGGGSLFLFTGSATVAVVGTVFTVEQTERGLRVEVEEGIVRVEARGATHRVTAGESVDVPKARVSAPKALAPERTRMRKQKSAAAKAPKPDVDAMAMIIKAEAARRDGRTAEARAAYQAASRGRDRSTAEAALLALARMEHELGAYRVALAALDARRARFGRGALEREAIWREVLSAEAAGDTERARRAATALMTAYPNSPWSERASAWLEAAEKE